MLSFSGWTPNTPRPCATPGGTSPLLAPAPGERRKPGGWEAPVTAGEGREEDQVPLCGRRNRGPVPVRRLPAPCAARARAVPAGPRARPGRCERGSSRHIWARRGRHGARPGRRPRVRARPPPEEAEAAP